MLVYPRVSRNRQDHKCSQELRLGSLPRWAQRELSCEPSWYDWRWSMTFSLYIYVYICKYIYIYMYYIWMYHPYIVIICDPDVCFFSASWQICSKAPARCQWCQWCQSACLRQQSPKWAASRCHEIAWRWAKNGKMVKIENLKSKMWEKILNILNIWELPLERDRQISSASPWDFPTVWKLLFLVEGSGNKAY